MYDSANQLIRENNQKLGKTWTWIYDNAGNILSKSEYAYTTGELGTPIDTITYTYGDADWGDLLTGYDGKTITYDGVGNPLSDGTWAYTWEHGRQLAAMSDGTTTWSYTYNADGMRVRRTNGTNTYTYVYNGSQLTYMTVGNNTLYFTYDASGTPMTVTYNGELYYYITNVQGDVVGIQSVTGSNWVAYIYDAWGNVYTRFSSQCSELATLNPLRYRGYVYDSETGLYYLQSRYYNPEMGRFINADALVSTGQDLLGSNMFAYCGNNPVNRKDPSGQFWISAIIKTVVVVVAVVRCVNRITNYINNSKVDSDPTTTTKNTIINDQKGATGENFSYGNFAAEHNACEAIAVHNAKVLLGEESTLTETIDDFHEANAMFEPTCYFGSNPYAIGSVLKKSNLSYSRVGLHDLTEPGTYIISYWNDNAPWGGLHTVAIYYDGVTYTTYNQKGKGFPSYLNPTEYAGNYICGYKVW